MKKGVSVSLIHDIGPGTSIKTYRVVFSVLGSRNNLKIGESNDLIHYIVFDQVVNFDQSFRSIFKTA